jgi:hypothetical protein
MKEQNETKDYYQQNTDKRGADVLFDLVASANQLIPDKHDSGNMNHHADSQDAERSQ